MGSCTSTTSRDIGSSKGISGTVTATYGQAGGDGNASVSVGVKIPI